MAEFKECRNSPDDFCYVCGKYSLTVGKRAINKENKSAYLSYFGCPISNQKQLWVPHFICEYCHRSLLKWMNDCDMTGLDFSDPMRWQKPTNHNEDCYFCLTNIDTNTGKIEYADVKTVIKPIPNKTPNAMKSTSPTVEPPTMSTCDESEQISPNELDAIIRDLDLGERRIEILVNGMEETNMLAPCK